MKNYQEALAYLKSLEHRGMRLGLARMKNYLRRHGNPHRKFPSIHIAGTNGKGSVSAMLASVLKCAGFKTGLYTSPHLLGVCERIQINGVPIPERELAQRLLAMKKASSPLTHFETLTACAFGYFADQGVDAAVVETGLGGRLDCTNVLERLMATVITTIGWDHMDRLGNTLAQITREKAGIIKPHVPLVSGVMQKELKSILRHAAARQHAPVLFTSPKMVQRIKTDWKGAYQDYWSHAYGPLRLGLLGSYQRGNLAIVLKVCEVLKEAGCRISSQALRQGLKTASWPGRFQVLQANGAHGFQPPVPMVLDGAHNEPGFKVLADSLQESPWNRLILLTGILKDKDPKGLLHHLIPLAQKIIVTEPPSDRAMPSRDLACLIREKGFSGDLWDRQNFPQAWSFLKKAVHPGEAVVVCGSLYLVGEALQRFQGSRS